MPLFLSLKNRHTSSLSTLHSTMVQKKARKVKPKSQAHSKPKEGKEFNAQLRAQGLRIVHITGDGNCLFRAVADQLEGNEEEHLKYRKMVVDYIQAHREEYEPFLEHDVLFDDYCKNMRETGTWAGHMELQVISLVTLTNICIHQPSSPRWHIENFKSTDARCIHLSYQNGDHFNSIRRKEDNGGGPAKGILLKTSVLEEKNSKDRAAQQIQSSKNRAQKKAQLLCAEEENSEETGEDCLGDNAEKCLQSEWSENEQSQCGTFVRELEKGHEEAPSMQMAASENGEDAPNNRLSQQVQVRVSRNKACLCGSKKKYKACCGTAMPHNRPHEVASLTEGLSNKARKQKLQNGKGIAKAEPKVVIIKEPLDMGFLCI